MQNKMDDLRKWAEAMLEGQMMDLSQFLPDAVQHLLHELRGRDNGVIKERTMAAKPISFFLKPVHCKKIQPVIDDVLRTVSCSSNHTWFSGIFRLFVSLYPKCRLYAIALKISLSPFLLNSGNMLPLPRSVHRRRMANKAMHATSVRCRQFQHTPLA